MKIQITTYDTEGNEIIYRNYHFDGSENQELLGEALQSIIEESNEYLEDRYTKWFEPITS